MHFTVSRMKRIRPPIYSYLGLVCPLSGLLSHQNLYRRVWLAEFDGFQHPFRLRMIFLLVIILACLVSCIAGETQIATFVDGSCKDSKQYFTAVGGYPDGVCMAIAAASTTSYGSFMISSLDPGCGGMVSYNHYTYFKPTNDYFQVTIYGNDTSDLICSATVIEVAEEIRCYNSSWIYLSVDGCTNSSTSSTSPAASTSVTSSVKIESHTGAIAGSIVGGVAGLAAILGAAYLAYRRRHRQSHDSPDQPAAEADGSEKPVVSELRPYTQKHELENPEKLVEAPTGQERAEMEGSLPAGMEAPLGSDVDRIFIVNS